MIILIFATFNGWYEGWLTWDKYSNYNMYPEKNYGEIGLIEKLPGGIESYISIYSDPYINFKRAHISFIGKHYNVSFFQSEDRHWFESPLLHLISSEKVRDESWGPNAYGMRTDFWTKNIASGFLISRYRITETGQATIWDFRRFYSSLNFGLLYLKKNWISGFNEVASGRIGLSKRPFNLLIEYAKTLVHPDTPDSNRASYAIEARIYPLGPFIITTRYYDYGENFRDELSNDFNSFNINNFGKKGIYGDVSYLLPKKAITITSKFYRENIGRYWLYEEIYVEFINNIFAKTYLDITRDRFGDVWKHLFFEITAEGKPGRVRLQYKIKDIGVKNKEYSIGQRNLIGFEGRLNLTNEISIYSRGVLGQDARTSWESTFWQVSIRPIANSEIYLEYGEASNTDADIVNDPDVADREDITTYPRWRLILKYYF